MSVKKTIAIIDATQRRGMGIAIQLSKIDCRLLLISDDGESLTFLSEKLLAENHKAEIECVECSKEGCWEADVIILTMSEQDEKAIVDRMKEVVIQKIVVSVSEERNSGNELRSLLPFSKHVKIYWNYPSKEMEISGDEKEATEEIMNIFEPTDFSLS